NSTQSYAQPLRETPIDAIMLKMNQFIEKDDVLYVTVDLDVFSASIAPGVSAPAVKGIDLSVFDPLFQAIINTGKIKVLDVAEC
ncbi:arginase family protein, partial [Acinetobacter nematophilus]|uniref:arginase family protein n=1 Tax=Acinetobacter nematophilus TaxID=2994642 RepID=UPI003AF7BCCF